MVIHRLCFRNLFFSFKAWGASGARSRSSSPQAALIVLHHGSLDVGDSNVSTILALNHVLKGFRWESSTYALTRGPGQNSFDIYCFGNGHRHSRLVRQR